MAQNVLYHFIGQDCIIGGVTQTQGLIWSLEVEEQKYSRNSPMNSTAIYAVSLTLAFFI